MKLKLRLVYQKARDWSGFLFLIRVVQHTRYSMMAVSQMKMPLVHTPVHHLFYFCTIQLPHLVVRLFVLKIENSHAFFYLNKINFRIQGFFVNNNNGFRLNPNRFLIICHELNPVFINFFMLGNGSFFKF